MNSDFPRYSQFARFARATRFLISILILVAILLIQGCGGPPQVVDDEECFSAVDALWTAVTSKRADLLEQSANELESLQSNGRLSTEGYDELLEIIDEARSEEWLNAAKSLKIFMQGQRKTGPSGSSSRGLN